jgi:predicted dehydrogenase
LDGVRLGILGTGWWAGVLADAAAASGSQVVSCFARDPDHRAAFAAAHGCRAAADLDSLLGDREIEGVLIATPHSTHADLAVEAASAGKGVYVEKPFTLTVGDANRAIKAASDAGVPLQVGHNRRRQPANRFIKKLIDDGALGSLIQLEGNQSSPSGHNPGLPMWRRSPDEAPAGGMTGMGVHMTDTFRYFAGPARQVFAISKRFIGKLAIDDVTTVLIEYEGGPVGYIGTSHFTGEVTNLAVYGTDAIVWNEAEGSELWIQRRAEEARTKEPVEVIDTVADELAEFARCIRTGDRPETGGEEALEVVAILDAVIESARSGRPVELRDHR